MATGDSVQLIKERLSVVDVISPYVELHKAGKNFKGKSPFTSEKTPSFYVSPERGMYYCFSSSQGGDIFTFVQKMEGVDFKGALKILADKAGVELVAEDPKKRDERDTLYAILEEATKFFQSELPKSTEASDYMKIRGVNPETIAKWRIGYVPGPPRNGWRHTRDHLLTKGFKDEDILKAGLAKQPEQNKQPYDIFRDRIMFPIMDPSGRVVGFSGRILTKGSEAPKYVNSPETVLFKKSEILYGYDKAKHGIHKLDFSLVVEGQFDVIMSHQAGYENTVAVSGTALTTHHSSLLQRLSNRVVLALDADRAGINAVKRSAEIMLARGIDLKVARIHGGKDPADLVQEDPKLLKKDIGESKHVIEFLLDILKEECQDERKLKIRARDEILPFVLRLDSQIEQDHFIGIVATAIGTQAEAVRLEVARLMSSRSDLPTQEEKNSAGEPAVTPVSSRKENTLAYLTAIAELLPDVEKDELVQRFTDLVGESPEIHKEKIPVDKLSSLIFILEQQIAETKPIYIREEWRDKLRHLNEIITKEKLQILSKEMREAEANGKEITEILNRIDELKKQLV